MLRRRLLLALLLFGLSACDEITGKNELIRRTEALEAGIAQQLPPGSSVEQVEAFLRSQGVEGLSTYEFTGGSILERNRPDLVPRVKLVTGAAIRDVYNAIIIKTSIYPRFYFDAERKLLWAKVGVISDGL